MAYKKIEKENYTVYENEGGEIISCSETPVIEQDGFVFKDLERTGELLPYEDWRLSDKIRAQDLANRLSLEEKIGLMLHSSHQHVPTMPNTTEYPHTYNGKLYPQSGAEPWTVTDQQMHRLKDVHVRHLLAVNYKDVETAVKWNNNLQSLCEKLPHGIPVNISSDPRNGVAENEEEYKTSGLAVSVWPEGIGFAATFKPETCKTFAQIASKEYRALGIATALGPQVDLATEPRWSRSTDSLSGHSKLNADLAKAYCDGMQTTECSEDGWGSDSVIAMAKHWPGGGTGEGGREAHYPFGKYAVYPGGNFEEHLKPFLDGAMNLDGKTGKCAAVMPYYTISWDQDKKYGENVGNSYSKYIVKDLLREKYSYEGVICTDWAIFNDMTPYIGSFMPGGKCYGVEHLDIKERYLKLIMNGIDQFGGVDLAENILAGYKIGCERYGLQVMEEQIHASAIRILTNMFHTGLFENPFLDLEKSLRTVGCKEYMKAGYEAQLASVVMLKNKKNVLPIRNRVKIFIPDRHIAECFNFVRMKNAPCDIHPVSDELVNEYFELVSSPDEADAAIVFVNSPFGNAGYEGGHYNEVKDASNGYEPISLQYRPYTADCARETSIAGGDPRELSTNRSYYKKTSVSANESDLDNVITTKEKMGKKPVIVCIRMKHATVLSELEPYADAILVDFGVQRKAIFDILTGNYEPTGLLPMILPKNMETVEKHCEDLAFDIEAYTDSQGNTYTFGFGLNYNGVIKDDRNERYKI